MSDMNPSSFKRRASFQAKVLVPVVTVMILLVVATMWLVNRRISAQLHEQAVRELDISRTSFLKNQHSDAGHILSEYSHIVNEPRFKSVTKTADVATTEDFLGRTIKEFIDDDGASIATFSFLEDNQHRVATANRDPRLDTAEFEARSAVAIQKAAKGTAQVDTICLGTKLFYVIALPVKPSDGEIAGVVTFGVPISPDEAQDIKQVTRSEIVFLADGKVVASSLASHDLDPQLASGFGKLSDADAHPDGHQTGEIVLAKEHYLCQAGYFPSLSGDGRLGYLLLSSYYGQSTVDLKKTQQMLLVVGLMGVSLSTLIVWLLVGRVTQPLRQLRDSAEAVGRGDFSRRVEVTSSDECGELAAVFNQTTENIKTSREQLEKTVETLKTTQNQLIQSEKLSGIGEFVAGVAHELNNPLTSVMGFAELLQQSDMAEQQRRYLDVIAKSAKRCQKIVASLLSFARRHAPERKVVCVNEIVESAVEILQYQMRTSNIEVITQLDPNLPATEVDSHQMQQVFLNIINNARQAMEGRPTKGLLRVTTESSDGKVRIIIQDNGPGIPPENITKIFNPFFTTKEVGKGTGLGLSLCYGLVSEHGGTITPSSEPGQGATFTIELPVCHALAGAADKKATGPLPVHARSEGVGKRVLVIDDEDTILQMINAALTMNGYKVDVARDGESALRRLGQYHYDLALCDWKMPGLNGQQVYERLHATDPDMSRRIIFITGDVVNEKTQQFLSSQHKVCLSKPFTLGEFRTAINRVMSPETTETE
jgi:signal transduction histidine kinase/ActR/RegA family two-component response regulator